jgi:hypothetical protein
MSTLFQWGQPGTSRPMTPDGTMPQNPCIGLPEPQLVLMGSGITDQQGRWELILRPALCVQLGIVDWVSMVATPSKSTGEFFVTMQPELITTEWSSVGGNLSLRAKSWTAPGEIEPNVPFSWHAAVLYHLELTE